MRKFIALLIAAVFAGMTLNAAAAEPKKEEKKTEKKAEKKGADKK